MAAGRERWAGSHTREHFGELWAPHACGCKGAPHPHWTITVLPSICSTLAAACWCWRAVMGLDHGTDLSLLWLLVCPCSMYPLYPPHPSACLDTTADYALRLEQLPHLLLLPSDLAPFAKVTGGAGGPTGAGSSTGEKHARAAYHDAISDC